MKQANDKPKTRKIAVDLDVEKYTELKDRFYHGQMTSLFRSFINSILILVRGGKISDIINYIQGENDLTLPKERIKKNVSNGSNKG